MVKRITSFSGILLILFGIILYGYPKYQVYSQSINLKREVQKFLNKTDDNYIALLKIPSINFERGLYSIGDDQSDLDHNIIFLDSSDMPDKVNGNTIIAGHSGNGLTSYFNHLKYLKLNDLIYLYYDKIIYQYKIVNIYTVDKTGRLAIKKDNIETTITLVTCLNDNKQLVIIGNLIREDIY